MTVVEQKAPEVSSVVRQRSPRSSVARELFSQPRTWTAGIVVVILILTAMLAPWIAPHNPLQTYSNGLSLIGAPRPPGTPHFPWGTDELGRDILSRIIWGARISIGVGVGATIVTLIIGVFIGIVAGYFGKVIDSIFMRIADMFLAFPFVLFVVFVATIFEPSVLVIILAIGILGWAPIARITRSRTLELRSALFVESAITQGIGNWRIIFGHILPNIVSTIFAYGFLQIGSNITVESALSYLGAGPPPPTPDWGAMVAEGQGAMATAPWLFFIPGVLIMVTIIAFNLLGDSWLKATNSKR